MPAAAQFDAIVIGAGPAGEVVVSRLAANDAHIAIVERELIGGECAYWACIPSKTLLRPPDVAAEARRAPGTTTPSHRWDEVAAYRDFMIRELDDSSEIESYEKAGTRVFKGAGRLRGPGEVEVDGQLLRSERIVIATGSDPHIPPIEGLDDAGYWTNREATTLTAVPDSAIVVGGGPVGIELSQMLRRFGADVSLFQNGDSLLPREDRRVRELLLDALTEDGIEVRLGVEVTAVERDGEGRLVRLANGDTARATELIVATGRRPRVHDLGLDRVGIEPVERGIEIDERCRAGEGVWAVGDVTGRMPFTHVAKYQARIAVADMFGEPARADYNGVPRVVFCDPEVAAVGMTEAQARDAGMDVARARIELKDEIARPWTYETEPRGELEVLADRSREVLVGAWAVAPLASEWIHYAALAIKAQIPLAVLRDTVAQFPTYAEAYVRALDRLDS